MIESSIPPIHQLIPHQAPMILVDRLIDVGDEHIDTQVDIQSNNLFFDQQSQTVPAYVGIEFMAQSIAAWSGYQAWKQGATPSIGFLLGSRRYHSQQPHFPLHTTLDIHAEKVMENNGMAVFQCEIKYQGESVASAQLNAFVPSKTQLHEMLGQPAISDTK
ncbi:hotdog family protein [Vibrio sp. S11_S32]|uniref:hotdog family protein n=1 Tax=Vibrio sp. S11_S32 TaxID=2720225 RepID=UPI0016811458|nr:hotdog family protein [Vibrio sp. S11_S32]MBD1575175.1 hotdog family protein [Vibrio sp. S11_S32]